MLLIGLPTVRITCNQ